MMRKLSRMLPGVLALLLVGTSVVAQEIPKGVNYKTAPESVNAMAKTALEAALVSDSPQRDFFGEVTVCGPMLWKALKPSADKVMLESKPLVANIQDPEPIVAEAKRILTPDERQSFWHLFRTKYADLSTAKVRKAHADEISFYWATIPFDIEEPFFVVETSAERFVAQLQNKNGKISLFWIDLVGDLRTLKSK